MNLIGFYKNGNFTTKIFSDGTKVRETKDNIFVPAFAENMDIKITNCCDMGCKFCHEGSTIDGKHGDILNAKFVDTLHPYQEVALGGGDVTSHPDLIPFLHRLKKRKVIANITVNQKHFEEKQDLIKRLVDEKLVYGIGVSIVNPTDSFISLVKKYPNAVIHVINGILTESDVEKLADNNLKMLILGYKQLRRGNDYFSVNQKAIYQKHNWLVRNLPDIINRFNTVSFDNLAIEQLDVQRLLTKEEWDEFYMGDDGTMTYYIDMVEQKFAQSSTAPFEERYDLLDSVDEMFNVIVGNKCE